jgi:predicted nucleic acid-binding protein
MCSGYYVSGEEREKDEFLTHILSSPNYRVVEVTVSIADEAGRIRASTGLRLPDALIFASGLREKADFLITYDESLRKADSLIRTVTAEEIIRRLDLH